MFDISINSIIRYLKVCLCYSIIPFLFILIRPSIFNFNVTNFILIFLLNFVLVTNFLLILYTSSNFVINNYNMNIINIFCKTLIFFEVPIIITKFENKKIIKHIFNNYIIDNYEYAQKYEKIFNLLLAFDNVSMCKLIICKFKTKLNIKNNKINYICKNNYLELFQLLTKYNMIKCSNDQILKFFEIICDNGYNDFLNFLIDSYPNLNIRPKNCKILQLACIKNHINIVETILNNYDINIHASDEIFFRIACQKGYFELAKIFILRFPDIDTTIKNEYCFRKTRIKYPEIAKWLINGCPIKYRPTKSARNYKISI